MEVFFSDPYIKRVEIIDVSEEENIYQFNPSFWVQKLKDKKFAFKIQNQNLFIWLILISICMKKV